MQRLKLDHQPVNVGDVWLALIQNKLHPQYRVKPEMQFATQTLPASDKQNANGLTLALSSRLHAPQPRQRLQLCWCELEAAMCCLLFTAASEKRPSDCVHLQNQKHGTAVALGSTFSSCPSQN